MRIFLIIALILGLSEPSIALDSDHIEKPHIDKELLSIENEIAQIREECVGKTTKISEKLKCGKQERDKYQSEGKIRGTEEYCHAHYRSLDISGLRELKAKIKTEWKLARQPLVTERERGELTKSNFETEMRWIDLRIMEFLERKKLK
jgi:hypothetical protein